jgi:uncharacterized protein YgbK (DUF1537 family)
MQMTKTILGCIADDHTGATDLAGLLARSGYPVSLRLGVPSDPPTDTAAFEVIALKCRTSPAAAAVTEVRAALNWLQKAGARRFFWKYCSTFDSTARGNIGPVAEALMAELGISQTIYCPAFPENQRYVFMGNLFVGEQPIAESPMKDHPLTPMRDSNLLRVLAPQVAGQAGLVSHPCISQGPKAITARLNDLAQQSIAHVLMDAVNASDLLTIATAAMDMPLITGGSAVAEPLPTLYRAAGLLADPPNTTTTANHTEGQIVLSGSCSAMTQKQVAAYAPNSAAYRLDPLILAKEGDQAVRDWLARQAPNAPKIIYATAGPDAVAAAQSTLGIEQAGALIENTLAQLARDARDQNVGRFVVAGGETAGAITKALGITRLTIGPEIAPGVPWTFATSQKKPLALALKSGNFGQPDFFQTAFEKLNAA